MPVWLCLCVPCIQFTVLCIILFSVDIFIIFFQSYLLLISNFACLLSGMPDYFDRNKILSGYDLSHYQVPHCIRVFFYFVWFVFIHHNFQFYFKLCTYCNILDINLSWNFNFVNYLLSYMKLLNYLFFNMFGSVLECCELTGVSLLWPWLIKWK